jgi:hypothetical protein
MMHSKMPMPHAMFVQDLAVEAEEPKNYAHAWNYPDKAQRAKCRDAINKEFLNMEKRKVWKKINQKDIPAGRFVLSTNGCGTSKEMVFFVCAWWRAFIAKSLVLTMTKILHR